MIINYEARNVFIKAYSIPLLRKTNAMAFTGLYMNKQATEAVGAQRIMQINAVYSEALLPIWIFN